MRRWSLALALMLAALTGPACGQGIFTATPAQLAAVSPQLAAVPPAGWEASHDFSLNSATARKVANIASWAGVSTEGALYGVRAWQEPDRKRAVLCTLGEIAATSGGVRGIKALVGRERPDKSDHNSFPSGHTAFAAMMQGSIRGPEGNRWRLLWPLGVGAGRVLAQKHFPTDVAAGAALGWFVAWVVCPAASSAIQQ